MPTQFAQDGFNSPTQGLLNTHINGSISQGINMLCSQDLVLEFTFNVTIFKKPRIRFYVAGPHDLVDIPRRVWPEGLQTPQTSTLSLLAPSLDSIVRCPDKDTYIEERLGHSYWGAI
jgi:hypothetical protein